MKQLNTPAGSTFAIDTILGVIKIRGTIFRVSITPPTGSPPAVSETVTCAIGNLLFEPVAMGAISPGSLAAPLPFSIPTCTTFTANGELSTAGILTRTSNLLGSIGAATAASTSAILDVNDLTNQARAAIGLPLLPPQNLPVMSSAAAGPATGPAAGTAASQSSVP